MKKFDITIDFINYLAIDYLEKMGIAYPSEAEVARMEEIIKNQMHEENYIWRKQKVVEQMH